MASANIVVLAGNVVAAPELKFLGAKQTPKCVFRLAVNNGYGENKKTGFYDIETWAKTAEFCDKFLDKGKPVLVTGELCQDQWENKEDGKKYSKVYVKGNNVEFLGPKPKDSESGPSEDDNSGDDDTAPF